jgi:O-antigen ligase
LFLFAGALLWMGRGDPRYGQLVKWVSIFALVALQCACMLFWPAGRANMMSHARGWPSIWILLAFAIVSASWSPKPGTSAVQAVCLVVSTLFALHFATRFPAARRRHLLGVALSVALLASAVLAVFLPQKGTMIGAAYRYVAAPNAWRGVFAHKNILGMAAALATLLAAFQLIAGGQPRRQPVLRTAAYVAALIGSLVLLKLSRSATSGVAVAAGVATLLALRIGVILPKRIRAPLAWIVVIAVGIAVVFGRQQILAALGRDPTLTTRTEVWRALWTLLAGHRVQGLGLGIFPSREVQPYVHWWVTHGHNGWMNLLTEVGAIGLALFTWCLVTLVVRLRPRLAEPEGQWLAAYLAFTLCCNLTESTFLVAHNLYWLLFLTACFTVSGPQGRAGETQVRTDTSGRSGATAAAGPSPGGRAIPGNDFA